MLLKLNDFNADCYRMGDRMFVPYSCLVRAMGRERANDLFDKYYHDDGKTVDAAMYHDIFRDHDLLGDCFSKNEGRRVPFNILAQNLALGIPFKFHINDPTPLWNPGYLEWCECSLTVKKSCITDQYAIFLGVGIPFYMPKAKASKALNTRVRNLLFAHVPKSVDTKVRVFPFATQWDLYKGSEPVVWLTDELAHVVIAMKATYFDLAYYLYDGISFYVDPEFTDRCMPHVVELRSPEVHMPFNTAEVANPHLGMFGSVGIINGHVLPPEHNGITREDMLLCMSSLYSWIRERYPNIYPRIVKGMTV